MSEIKTICVVVSFNPPTENFKEKMLSIVANASLIVVDNGSNNAESLKQIVESIDGLFLPLAENLGIAHAQNVGINQALVLKADFVWLSDQDTYYEADFLSNMLSFYDALPAELQQRVGVIGPSIFDTTKNAIQDFVVLDPAFKSVPVTDKVHYPTHIIASGMLIPSHVFAKVGFKNEALFIDWVDFEWCWRARSQGLEVLQAGEVFVTHALGDGVSSIAGREVVHRSAARHYFMVRNEIFLGLRCDLIPLMARVVMILRPLRRILIMPFLTDSFFKYFGLGLKGLWHALLGRLGPLK